MVISLIIDVDCVQVDVNVEKHPPFVVLGGAVVNFEFEMERFSSLLQSFSLKVRV